MLQAERYARQLTETSLFNGLHEKQIRAWLRGAAVRIEEYDAGAYLFTKSDIRDHLGVILLGSADVYRMSSDGKMRMSTLHKNDLFGAASLFSEQAYVTDIICKRPTRVLLIDGSEVLKLLSSNPTVLRNYLQYLNSRIRFLSKRLDAFSKNTVPARVLSYLKDEAVDHECQIKSFTALSETLCVSRATLYRALDALEASGKIRRNGKQINITEG